MNKFAVFRIADEMFGIGIGRVVEIITPQEIFSIPGLPEFLAGVISVRGSIIPLIDLRRRFGAKPAGRKERVILVRFGSEKAGFVVDEIKEIMTLSPEEITPPPTLFKGFKTEYLNGIGKKDGGIVILLNIDNLLTSQEKIRLEESIEMIEERSERSGAPDK